MTTRTSREQEEEEKERANSKKKGGLEKCVEKNLDCRNHKKRRGNLRREKRAMLEETS